MYSTFYEYAYMKTADVTKTFSTKDVEEFMLHQVQIFSEGNGLFSSRDKSFSMQIMLVKNFDSWNSNDYNSEQANYIAFDAIRGKFEEYKDLTNQLSELLNIRFQIEE